MDTSPFFYFRLPLADQSRRKHQASAKGIREREIISLLLGSSVSDSTSLTIGEDNYF